MTYSFFMSIKIPRTTHQQKRVNHKTGAFYDSANIKTARETFLWALRSHKPQKPIDGAVELTITWQFGTKTKKLLGTYKTTRPDLTNHVKLLEDCMTDLQFWVDDAQVARQVQTKLWVPMELEGIGIKVRMLEE